jgi:hypothetical protein
MIRREQPEYTFRKGSFREVRFYILRREWYVLLCLILQVIVIVSLLYLFSLFPSSLELPVLLLMMAPQIIPFYLMGVECFILPQPANRSVWVACHHDRIIGWALLLKNSNHTILARVFIDSRFRRRRIGSRLILNSLKQVQKPVYLIC